MSTSQLALTHRATLMETAKETGQLIHWPTIPTLALFPLIVWAYVRLARKEEAQMVERFGDEYLAYGRQVPRFVPRRGEWRRLLEETRTSTGDRP
ncbi:MAG: hypothetical protein HYT85_00410 [candidate division NC10 bacterium]|nr:hypothetical protein [candidate division NC10 bacterium]